LTQLALTIDVESDWGGRYSPQKNCFQGVEQGLDVFLDLLHGTGAKATFFVSAEILQKHGEKIAFLAKEGHEVASHGFNHNLDYANLSPRDLFFQADQSRKLLQECTNSSISGFRVPQFRENPNLHKVLAQAGYHYDSSVTCNSLPGRYRASSSHGKPVWIGEILEIPVSKFPILPLPFGLLWVNLCGISSYKLLQRLRRDSSELEVLYLHPFDLLPKRWNRQMKFHVNLFYTYRSSAVVNTMKSLLRAWTKAGIEFTVLREVYNNCKESDERENACATDF
jgi:peptidoglycan/xylan/chitin deacetylase (PgdA/CDA1 family)